MRTPSTRLRIIRSAALLGALVLATVVSLSCGGDSEPEASSLPERVHEAMAEADYSLRLTGPFGDGTPMSVDVDHVAPDRWRLRQQGDCAIEPDEQVIIGRTMYRRDCDEQGWHAYSLGAQQAATMTDVFDWPWIYLSAVPEPRTSTETGVEGTEVIALTGEVDCEALVGLLSAEDYQATGDECPPDLSITMNARIEAEDFLLLGAEWSWGEERITYRYSDFSEVEPIVEPSPIAPTATPPSGPLPTPAAPPATPHVAP